MNKILHNKTAKGIVSLATIVIILSSILVGSLFYEGSITANVIQENSIGLSRLALSIKEINDLNELKYLNEGWYEIRNGHVFYLESFDSYASLNLKIKNPPNLNGLAVVDGNGKIEFTEKKPESAEIEHSDETPEPANLITGEATGFEAISGMQSQAPPGQPLSLAITQLDRGQRTESQQQPTLPKFVQSQNGADYIYTGYNNEYVYVSQGRYLISTYDASAGKLTPTTKKYGAWESLAESVSATAKETITPVNDITRRMVASINSNPNARFSFNGNQVTETIPISDTNYVRITVVNLDNTVVSVKRDTIRTTSGAAAQGAAGQPVTYQFGNKHLTEEQIKFITKSDYNQLTPDDEESIMDLITNGKLAVSNGVTIVKRDNGNTDYLVPGGRNANINNVRFTAPQGSRLEVTHIEGNQYEIGGKEYVYHQGKVIGIDEQSDGKFAVYNPRTNAISYENFAYEPESKIVSSSGTPLVQVQGTQQGENILTINTEQGAIGVSVKEMPDAKIKELGDVIANARKNNGRVFASSNRVEIVIGNDKTVYDTKTGGITKYVDDKKTSQTDFKAIQNNKIAITRTFDEAGKQTGLKIGERVSDAITAAPEIERLIDWKNYDGGSRIPLTDKRVVELSTGSGTGPSSTAMIFADSRSSKPSREINYYSDGYSITDFKYEGKFTTTTTTGTFTDDDVTMNSRTIQKIEDDGSADGKLTSRSIERTLKQKDGKTISLRVEGPKDSESKITINGKTINAKTLNELGIDSESFDPNENTVSDVYSATSALDSILTEAVNFGINLQTASASVRKVQQPQPPPREPSVPPTPMSEQDKRLMDLEKNGLYYTNLGITNLDESPDLSGTNLLDQIYIFRPELDNIKSEETKKYYGYAYRLNRGLDDKGVPIGFVNRWSYDKLIVDGERRVFIVGEDTKVPEEFSDWEIDRIREFGIGRVDRQSTQSVYDYPNKINLAEVGRINRDDTETQIFRGDGTLLISLPKGYSYDERTNTISGPLAGFVNYGNPDTDPVIIIPADVERMEKRENNLVLIRADDSELILPQNVPEGLVSIAIRSNKINKEKKLQDSQEREPQEITARILTSSDGKKSITIKPDGTTELEERVSKGKVKTLITKTSEGVTTQTTCKDATGCAKDDATGQLQGQYDSIKLNTANREVLETSSRLKSAKGQAIDEIVQSGWTLGAPDKEGYRAIEGEGIQKDTGHDVKYYKNGKIYIKDAKGKYQESPFEGDNKVEKKFQEELQKSKAEDYQEVTVKYGNPPDFRKSPYITEIKVGTDSWNLGEPDDERYQEISGFRLSENTNADGKSISAYTGKKYYKDGEIYIRDANGKYVRSPFVSDKEIEKQFEEAKVEGQLDKANDLKNELYEEERKEASREKYRKFFANVERVFTQFRGLRYYATLFMDDKDLMRWRQDVDEAFSKLYLGSEYWISEICEKDIEGKSEGVAYAETPQGLAQIAAHIEATRTQPILNLSDETAYIYKITFNVRNGDYKEDMRAPENMTFNAIIVRESESLSSSLSSNNFVPLFKRNIHLGRGEAFGRMGSTAIVKETKNSYSAVCLIFKEIPLKWKLDENKKISITWTADDGSQKYAGTWWTLCNTIPTSSGEPAALPRQGAAAPQGSDAELNDF